MASRRARLHKAGGSEQARKREESPRDMLVDIRSQQEDVQQEIAGAVRRGKSCCSRVFPVPFSERTFLSLLRCLTPPTYLFEVCFISCSCFLTYSGMFTNTWWERKSQIPHKNAFPGQQSTTVRLTSSEGSHHSVERRCRSPNPPTHTNSPRQTHCSPARTGPPPPHWNFRRNLLCIESALRCVKARVTVPKPKPN